MLEKQEYYGKWKILYCQSKICHKNDMYLLLKLWNIDILFSTTAYRFVSCQL